MRFFLTRLWVLIIGNWSLVLITALVVVFSKVIWPFPAKNLDLLDKCLITILMEVIFAVFIDPLKFIFLRWCADKDMSYVYSAFIKEFDGKISNLLWKKYFNPEKWNKEKSTIELILRRALVEIDEYVDRNVIEVFRQDMKTLKPVKIIATSTSPLSLWFHHVIMTYFIAQTSELACGRTSGQGLTSFERFYFLRTKKLLDDIRYSSDIFFDYWHAATEIHQIAQKKLYIVYPKKDFPPFPMVMGKEDEKFLMYMKNNDEILSIRSFRTEDNHTSMLSVDLSAQNSYKHFIDQLHKYIKEKGVVRTRDAFFNSIATDSETVIWEV